MKPPAPSVQSIVELLRGYVQRGEFQLPVVPGVTARLSEVMRDEDRVNPAQVADVIATEPAIAASVLRLANSVAFGGLRPVLDLEEAVGRIGLRQVASLATTLAMHGTFQARDPARQSRLNGLWEHALAAAVATRVLALGHVAPEAAYLAGLLHDVGSCLVLRLLEQVDRRQLEPVSAAATDELITLLHEDLGHKLLRAWRIPDPICEITLHHHDPRPDPDDALLVRVQAGDAVADYLLAADAGRAEQPLNERAAIERLGLGDVELADLVVEVEDQLDRLKQLI